jgi:hypothetical protein
MAMFPLKNPFQERTGPVAVSRHNPILGAVTDRQATARVIGTPKSGATIEILKFPQRHPPVGVSTKHPFWRTS